MSIVLCDVIIIIKLVYTTILGLNDRSIYFILEFNSHYIGGLLILLHVSCFLGYSLGIVSY